MQPITVDILGVTGVPLIEELRNIESILRSVNYQQSLADVRAELIEGCEITDYRPECMRVENAYGELSVLADRNSHRKIGLHFLVRENGVFKLDPPEALRFVEHIAATLKMKLIPIA